MISKVYDDYKSKVLNTLSNNINFVKSSTFSLILDEKNYPKIRELDITENVLEYGHKDKYKKLSDPTFENPALNVGDLMILMDENGETIGEELIKESFLNRNICGKPDYLKLYRTDASLVYDISGSETISRSGLIVYSSEDFPCNRKGLDDSYSSNIGTFFIDEVDDDGIVVLPPNCQGLCVLDNSLASKINKIICISPKALYPHLFGLKYRKYISDIDLSDLEFLDVSHISIEVYTNSSIDLSNYGSYHNYKYESANGGPVFCFKELIYNFNSTNLAYNANIRLSNVPIILNLVGPNLESIIISSSSINYNLTINNLTSNEVFLYLRDDYESLSCSSFTLNNIKNVVLKKEKEIISGLECMLKCLNPGSNFYFITIHKLNILSKDITYLDRYCDIMSEMKSKNINFYVSTTTMDIKQDKLNTFINSPDYYRVSSPVYLLDLMMLYYLASCYGSNFISDESLIDLKNRDIFYNFVSNLFGKCDSTFGSLGFKESRERFCDPDLNITFKSFNLKEGTVGIECGAGVTATLNLLQVYLLRLFGLSSYQYVSLKSSNKYPSIYNPENRDSRKDLSGLECIVFSDRVNNRFSEDDLYDLAVLSFMNYSSSSYGYQPLSFFNYPKIDEKDVKPVYSFNVFLGKTDGAGEFNYRYMDEVTRYNTKLAISDNVNLHYKTSETTWKVMSACIKYSKQALLAYQKTLELLSFVRNSKSCGLYGGIGLECIKSARNTNSQLPKDLIMDKVESDYDYSVFTVKRLDTGEVLNIESKTLFKLLKNGDVYSDNLNHTLIKDEVIWLQNDYDKKVTADIESMLGAKVLFADEDGTSTVDYGLSFSSGGLANSFTMRFYNIGNELLLPSYITCAYESSHEKSEIIKKFGEDSWTDVESVGIEVGNDKEVDVTYKINSLLKDTSNGKDVRCINNSSVARKNNISFYCGEKAVYKNNRPLVIESIIANNLLELPRKISIDFCYDYKRHGLALKYNHDVKIVVRDSSTIYRITCATEVDIADNCLIHSNAFSSSRIKKCVIHGGSIPRYCFSDSEDFEELVVDGGHVAVDITAFHNCAKFKGITTLNGGTYIVVNADSSISIDEIRNSDNISVPFYKQLVDDFDASQSMNGKQVDDVIPNAINSDLTIELLSINGNKYSLSIDRILYLYENGLLNFSHVHANETYNYIEELEHSKLKCLVFSRETRNPICAFKVLLLLETNKVKGILPLKERKLIFAYQKSDWLNGKVTEVPIKYLSPEYSSGILFDNEYINNKYYNSKNQDAIVYHFWQNLSYYQTYHWENLDEYYRNSRSNLYLRPDDGSGFYYSFKNIHVNAYDTLYFPASHEYNWYYKMMDKNLIGSSDVLIGDNSRYGRLMHNKRYILPNAFKVVLIPGIGENCLIHIKKCKQCGGHYSSSLLWKSCNVLEIRTPTIIESNALIYYINYQDTILSYYDKALSSFDIYADTEMAFLSVLFKKCVVHNSSLIINCDNIQFSNRVETVLDKDIFIEFDGDCKFQVNGLNKGQIRFLISSGYNNFAYQLLVNSDTLDSLLKLPDIKEFMDKCKSGIIKVKRVVKKHNRYIGDIGVSVTPYPKSKLNSNYKSIFEDDIDENEELESNEDSIDNSLSNGIIPDMFTLDYIEEKINEIDPDVYKEMLDSQNSDIDIDFMNLEIKSPSDTLIDMCGVDVEKLSSDAIKELNDNSLNSDVVTIVEEVLNEESKKEAEEVRDEMNQRMKEKSELLDKVRFTAIELDEYRKRRKQRIEARKKYDLEKNPLADKIVEIREDGLGSELSTDKSFEVNSDIFNNEISSNFVPIPKNNTNHVIENIDSKKPKGLAGSILLDVLKTYQNNVKPELVELEILNPIYKNDVLVGYEVLNLDSNQKKRLSLDNIKKLRDSGKYNIVNIANFMID